MDFDQYGQVIGVLVSARRDASAARRFFRRALSALKVTPTEMVTDAAAVYPGVLDELIPRAWHHVERYANNLIEADHSQLKHRLRSLRDLRQRRLTLAGDRDHVTAKLQRERFRHGTHPSREERIVTGQESTEPGEVPFVCVHGEHPGTSRDAPSLFASPLTHEPWVPAVRAGSAEPVPPARAWRVTVDTPRMVREAVAALPHELDTRGSAALVAAVGLVDAARPAPRT